MKTQNTSASAKSINKMFLVVAILFSSFTLLTSCQKDENLAPASASSSVSDENSASYAAKGEEIVIAVKTDDNDFGLPVYSFEARVAADGIGHVIFNGYKNVRHEGTVEFNVDEWLIPALADHAIALGFFDMQDEYPAEQPRQAKVTLIQIGERSKTVIDYGSEMPDELRDIQMTIEGKLGINRFTTGE